MFVELSKWLLEDIDENQLETNSDVSLLETDTVYNVYSNNAYLEYSRYYNYSDYYNYYNYYNYYDYYNYSNSISVVRHPVSQSALENETVTFSVGASNTIDSCQWYIADSATATGVAITGAISATLNVLVTRELDGKYYYCVVRRGGNTATSSRASLTVMKIDAFNIYVNQGDSISTYFVRTNPGGTEITEVSLSDPSVALVTLAGGITGLAVGSTTCTVTGSNGATATFEIIVLPNTPVHHQVAVFANTAIAIRGYKGISRSLYPNQMASSLLDDGSSRIYSTIEELYLDIANSIRSIDGTTGSISPYDFYYRILSLANI